MDNGEIIPYPKIEQEAKKLGFCLTYRAVGKNSYYYAGRRFEGKLKWVYIGADYQQAKEKIVIWLRKHQPDYLSELSKPRNDLPSLKEIGKLDLLLEKVDLLAKDVREIKEGLVNLEKLINIAPLPNVVEDVSPPIEVPISSTETIETTTNTSVDPPASKPSTDLPGWEKKKLGLTVTGDLTWEDLALGKELPKGTNGREYLRKLATNLKEPFMAAKAKIIIKKYELKF